MTQGDHLLLHGGLVGLFWSVKSNRLNVTQNGNACWTRLGDSEKLTVRWQPKIAGEVEHVKVIYTDDWVWSRFLSA